MKFKFRSSNDAWERTHLACSCICKRSSLEACEAAQEAPNVETLGWGVSCTMKDCAGRRPAGPSLQNAQTREHAGSVRSQVHSTFALRKFELALLPLFSRNFPI